MPLEPRKVWCGLNGCMPFSRGSSADLAWSGNSNTPNNPAPTTFTCKFLSHPSSVTPHPNALTPAFCTTTSALPSSPLAPPHKRPHARKGSPSRAPTTATRPASIPASATTRALAASPRSTLRHARTTRAGSRPGEVGGGGEAEARVGAGDEDGAVREEGGVGVPGEGGEEVLVQLGEDGGEAESHLVRGSKGWRESQKMYKQAVRVVVRLRCCSRVRYRPAVRRDPRARARASVPSFAEPGAGPVQPAVGVVSALPKPSCRSSTSNHMLRSHLEPNTFSGQPMAYSAPRLTSDASRTPPPPPTSRARRLQAQPPHCTQITYTNSA